MYVIHVGISGYPGNSAPLQRIRLTFKGLKSAGFYPLVINKHSMGLKAYRKVNLIEGIPVLFTSLYTNRPTGFFKRNINKVSGLLNEVLFIIKKKKKIDAAILYTPSFGELFYYRIVSKLTGVKLLVQYVELRSSIAERNSFIKKINDQLFDNYFHYFCDGVIAISDFLVKHISKKSATLPVIKIPVMCDFASFKNVKPYSEHVYFMYCGSIAYSEVIEFIIDTFSGLKQSGSFNGNLILVISGEDDRNWSKISSKILNAPFGKDVIIKSNILYSDLLSLYKGAKFLMIPLRNTVQDTARFPHKIGEYTASGRPVFSSNFGELSLYFKDGYSALLTSEYDVNEYVEKMAMVIENDTKLNEIGTRGFEIGISNFDYLRQTQQLKKFIINL